MDEITVGKVPFDAEAYRRKILDSVIDPDCVASMDMIGGMDIETVKASVDTFFSKGTVVRFLHGSSLIFGEPDPERYNVVYDKETSIIENVWKG